MTLSDIVQAAQGGKAVDNLAAEFGADGRANARRA